MEQALISIIIPCYEHGLFIEECLESIFLQTYNNIEIIIIDDGSMDSYTLEVLERLSKDSRIKLIRHLNSGPSAARNRGIREAKGKFILPLDADNYLSRDAVQLLYEQLIAAPPEVKYIYQNQQFFGNRNDYHLKPDFNYYLLLKSNFIDTCSLINRSVFDEGLAFNEAIYLGHEDWVFFVELARKGYFGQLCHRKTLFSNKQGFTRSDLVTSFLGDFQKELRELYPDIFNYQSLLQIKKKWAPAISIILDFPDNKGEFYSELTNQLTNQTCQDFEIVPSSNSKHKFATFKGKYVLLWTSPVLSPFNDVSFIEKSIRCLDVNQSIFACALVALPSDSCILPLEIIEPLKFENQGKIFCGGILLRIRHLYEGLKHEETGHYYIEQFYQNFIEDLVKSATQRSLTFQWRTLIINEKLADLPQVSLTFEISGYVLLDLQKIAEKKYAEQVCCLIDSALEQDESAFIEFELRLNEDTLYQESEEKITGENFYWNPENTKPLYSGRLKGNKYYQLFLDADSSQSWENINCLGSIYTQPLMSTKALVQKYDEYEVIYGLEDPNYDVYEVQHPANKAGESVNERIIGYTGDFQFEGLLGLYEVTNISKNQTQFTTSLEWASKNGLHYSTFLGFIEAPILRNTHGAINATSYAKSNIVNWSLFEIEKRGTSKIFYSLHPDSLALFNNNYNNNVPKVSVKPNSNSVPLSELTLNDTHFFYTISPGKELTDFMQFRRIIGNMFIFHNSEYQQVFRHSNPNTGSHKITFEYNFPGFRNEGSLGFCECEKEDIVPLQRFKRIGQDVWMYRIAGQALPLNLWRFEGTLGFVWKTKYAGMLELAQEFIESKVYIQENPAPLLQPLFLLKNRETSASLLSCNKDEKDGFEQEEIIGYIKAAVPHYEIAQFPTSENISIDKNEFITNSVLSGYFFKSGKPLFKRLISDSGFEYVTKWVNGTGLTLAGYLSESIQPGAIPVYHFFEKISNREFCSTNIELSLKPNLVVLGVAGYLKLENLNELYKFITREGGIKAGLKKGCASIFRVIGIVSSQKGECLKQQS